MPRPGAGRAKRVLVDSRTAMNYDIVAPVVQAMASDSRVRFAFTASEEPARLKEIYQAAPADARLVHPYRAALSKWSAYVTSDFMWATLPRRTSRVQMFHGVAGKYGFDAPTGSMRQWHRLFFVNERRLRNFVACGVIDEDSPAVRLIGMPKVDCLVDGSLRRDDVLRDLSLDPDRPTVLYGPTWSPASSLNRLGTDLIERLVRLPINVIVKLHDRSFDSRPMYSGGVDWRARLTPLLAHPHARLVGGTITPYLAAADVMITDHSSAGFEFLLLDRPLIRIELPELIAGADVHPDYVRLLSDASHNVTGAGAAARAVMLALEDHDTRSATRRAIASSLFYRPGTAAARAAAALYELMELTPLPSMTVSPHEAPSWAQNA
jgi:hypothetical protein